MNSKITSEDNKGTKDSEELYISKYGMKRDELVVWTQDLLLDPYAVEVCLDEAYMGIRQKARGQEED